MYDAELLLLRYIYHTNPTKLMNMSIFWPEVCNDIIAYIFVVLHTRCNITGKCFK